MINSKELNINPKISHLNNFDFLRLLFASLVVVSHSFSLTRSAEPLATLSNGQADLGSFSVASFFVMSGYLIFQSLDRSKTMLNYVWKRVLRLYPGLIGLIIVTGILIPIVYEGENIFREFSYYSYGPNVLSLYNYQYYINGVFESNPYQGAINGCLWTLCYEFTMYISLLFVFPFRKNKMNKLVIIIAFSLAYFLFVFKPNFLESYFGFIHLSSKLLFPLASYFLAGCILSFVNLKAINKPWIKLSLIGSLITLFYFNVYKEISPILLPIVVILVGISKTKYISTLSFKIGDLSYGVYIYGFLIQQVLLNYFQLSALELIIPSLLITYVFAYFSWHFIEKKMLKFKNFLS